MKFIKFIDDDGKYMLIRLDEIVSIYYDSDESCYCISVKSGDDYLLPSDFDINVFSSMSFFDILDYNCF